MNLNAEVIDLASEGYFYSHQSPLAGGTLKILPITAAHEELLANGNLAKRGLLEREFLNSVVEGGVNYDELLHCDKVSILLNLRIANYGSTAKAKQTARRAEKNLSMTCRLHFVADPLILASTSAAETN